MPTQQARGVGWPGNRQDRLADPPLNSRNLNAVQSRRAGRAQAVEVSKTNSIIGSVEAF